MAIEARSKGTNKKRTRRGAKPDSTPADRRLLARAMAEDAERHLASLAAELRDVAGSLGAAVSRDVSGAAAPTKAPSIQVSDTRCNPQSQRRLFKVRVDARDYYLELNDAQALELAADLRALAKTPGRRARAAATAVHESEAAE